jgi:hypothetical protein
MDPKKPARPVPTPPSSTPLTDLVDEKLNRPLPERIADELEEREEQPERSGTTDYARGTAEHEDDRET